MYNFRVADLRQQIQVGANYYEVLLNMARLHTRTSTRVLNSTGSLKPID
jgi:hypothetical protein